MILQIRPIFGTQIPLENGRQANESIRRKRNDRDHFWRIVQAMNKQKLGKIIISFVLIVGAIVSVAVDWNDTHLFNPDWHPHARFHDALMLALLCGVSAIGLWQLWRKSAEPELAIKIAALIIVAFWLPFFWITWLVPGTSLLATEGVSELVLHLGGLNIYPNVIIAGVLLTLTATGYFLTRLRAKDEE